MNCRELQANLNALYDKIPRSYPSFLEDKNNLNGPFLVRVTQEYMDSAKKIVIVGKETNGWLSFKEFCASEDSLCRFLKEYCDFSFGVKCRGPFRNVFREIARRCSETDKSVIWLNLLMFDYNGKSVLYARQEVKAFVLQIQAQLFVEQLNLLRPDAVVFFTGINSLYDSLLRENYYPKIIFHDVNLFEDNPNSAKEITESKMYLHRLRHGLLPPLTFRTYHPGFLYRQGRNVKNRVIDHIITEIKNGVVV